MPRTASPRQARRLGVDIRERMAVRDVVLKNDGSVRGVAVGGEVVEAEAVINAAGPWASLIGQMAGVSINTRRTAPAPSVRARAHGMAEDRRSHDR